MRIIIDFLYLLAGIAIAPVAVYRLIRHNRYRKGWAQRFGRISRRAPAKKCIWLHAVSVGEVNAARTVIEKLRAMPARPPSLPRSLRYSIFRWISRG